MGFAASNTCWRTWRCGLAARKAGMVCRYSSARCAASSLAFSSTRWKVAESESDSRMTRGKWRKKA
eukprot:5924283-Pleurochrysis_carterae.AAC.1